jgi:hypothetical protein
MRRHYKQYTDDDIVQAAKQVKSIAGLLRILGLRPVGGNYGNIKRHLKRLDIDCAHWTGRAWNRGSRVKDWVQYRKIEHLKRHMIRLTGHRCQRCRRRQWQTVDIPLEVHHIDGDRCNNRLTNLELLCPNCHALTDYYRGRKLSTVSVTIGVNPG